MSTAAPAPEPYQVVYAERVRRRLLSLAEVARDRGDGEAFVAALKEFHRRLCIYPQFGDPLTDLKREDFLRILTEPKHALTRQYAELLATEGVALEFAPDGVEALADIAFEVNRTTQNIGARRLHTILERVVEEVSFRAPDLPEKRVVIDGPYVRGRLAEILEKEDLTKFIL